jgi:hypothetical protein
MMGELISSPVEFGVAEGRTVGLHRYRVRRAIDGRFEYML